MKEQDLYLYKATITNVVDGDTMDAKIDVGFGVTVTHRLRIEKLDTPETWRPKTEAEYQHGMKAKEKAKELLEGKTLLIKTGKETGVYGRYLADIQLENGDDYAQYMIAEGYQKLPFYE